MCPLTLGVPTTTRYPLAREWIPLHPTSLLMGWLKRPQIDSCCREAGHANPAMGWLKGSPNPKLQRLGGHRTFPIGTVKPVSSVKCRSPFGQTTNSRPRADTDPRSSTTSNHAHHSTETLSTTVEPQVEAPTPSEEPGPPAPDSSCTPSRCAD